MNELEEKEEPMDEGQIRKPLLGEEEKEEEGKEREEKQLHLRNSFSLHYPLLEENELDTLDPLRKCSSMESRVGFAFKISLLLIVVAGGVTTLALFFFSNSAKSQFLNGISWVSSLPQPASSFLMIAAYAISLLFFCPGTPFNLACGFMFGVYIGSLVATCGCLLGSIIAYFMGKTIAREWVKQQMKNRPFFEAVDWAIERNGLYIVFLTRLSPLFPFPLLNFAFGSTKVKLWQYILGTLGGILPATIGYTYLGTLIKSLTQVLGEDEEESDSHKEVIIAIVGSILTVASIVVISVITKRAIDNATKEFQPVELELQVLEKKSVNEIKV